MSPGDCSGRPGNILNVRAREAVMKVTVLVKATADSEAGVMPTAQLIAGLARFKEW